MSKKSSKKLKAPIAITTGDHHGIGPEVISKGLKTLSRTVRPTSIVIFGLPELYKPFRKILPKKWQLWTENEVFGSKWSGPRDGYLNFIIPESNHVEPSRREAYLCGRYIELAVKGTLAGLFSAITTGPIDKNELHKGGYPFDGHTEMLRVLCKAPSVTMMMASPKMRTTLVTVHEALRNIAAKLTPEAIVTCIENTAQGLKRDFSIKKPRLAVLGLNPHASDQGLFGDEEKTIIEPAIEKAKARLLTQIPGISLAGPFAPDGFFAQWQTRHSKNFDAIICMYHDQGLIPIKLIDFENTVNVSLGLPLVRTSVDHGVGYDIAGKNKANPASFCAALKLALKMV